MSTDSAKRAAMPDKAGPSTKKPRTEPRLVIGPKYQDFSKLKVENVVRICNGIHPKQFDYLRANAANQVYINRFAQLQCRYHDLEKHHIEEYAKWSGIHVSSKTKGELKLSVKMLVNLARTMYDIREDWGQSGADVVHKCARYESSALATLITISAQHPETLSTIPDILARFEAVLSYLERHRDMSTADVTAQILSRDGNVPNSVA